MAFEEYYSYWIIFYSAYLPRVKWNIFVEPEYVRDHLVLSGLSISFDVCYAVLPDFIFLCEKKSVFVWWCLTLQKCVYFGDEKPVRRRMSSNWRSMVEDLKIRDFYPCFGVRCVFGDIWKTTRVKKTTPDKYRPHPTTDSRDYGIPYIYHLCHLKLDYHLENRSFKTFQKTNQAWLSACT